jgi:hypothetical protein
MGKLRSERIHPELRAGLQPHIYLHNVANVEPNSAKYRMFYRVEDGTLRLFKPGDPVHPARKGKICPKRVDLPERYHYLLDWYEKDYCAKPLRQPTTSPSDFVLGMRGVGKEIWSDIKSDAFVDRLRSEWAPEREPLEEGVWKRVVSYQGKEFRTKTGIPFTYSVEGDSGIWFYHQGGKLIEMRLWRGQLNQAVKRCLRRVPEKVTEFTDLRDPSYLYGLLTDQRIRDTDW